MKNKKLFELFRDSKEPNFMKFLKKLEDDGVIIAEHIFEEKRRQDEWWKVALDRSDTINSKDKKDE